MALLQQAMNGPVPVGTAPIDISVSRMYGENTVTVRTQLGGGVPAAGMPVQQQQQPPQRMRDPPMPVGGSAAPVPLADMRAEESVVKLGLERAYTRNSFYEDETEVPSLLAEIERLKRKALSQGINLTSPNENVPAEDVVVLKQIFAIADDTGDGRINKEQLGQLHTVLGEPLSDSELNSAFKAMDAAREGWITFEDFLAW